MTVKELVSKHHHVIFDSYRAGFFYYNIWNSQTIDQEDNKVYQFTVPLEDIRGATLLSQDKAITFMRWIRKAIEDKTLITI